MSRPFRAAQRAVVLLCISTPLAAQSPALLVSREITLDGVKLSVSVPETHASRIRELGSSVIIDASRNMRLQRQLILATGEPRAGGPLGPKRELPGGARLSYRLDDDTGGGSGGPIAELNGILEIGTTQFAITCTDQSEWSRDPEWCLPLLAQIRLVKAP